MGGFETPAKDFLNAFMVWNPAAAVASGIHFIAMVYYRAAIQDQVPDYADYFKIDNGVFPVLVVFIIEDVLIFLYLLYHAFRILKVMLKGAKVKALLLFLIRICPFSRRSGLACSNPKRKRRLWSMESHLRLEMENALVYLDAMVLVRLLP